ncbi:MAG: hypothetical protein DCC57_00245 [Chloroflexi bacterium]|nr:MAG: hypothetical protein DCC57_00245 [Chloroflexota bacterium]
MEAVTTISSKHQIVIPRTVREQFRLRPGQKLMFIPYKKSMRLVIVPPIEEALGMFRGIKSDEVREEESNISPRRSLPSFSYPSLALPRLGREL